MIKSNEIVEQISRSKIFRDYERAFGDAMLLPLAIRPPEIWHHALSGQPHENPFCSLMATTNRSCSACLQNQQKLIDQEKPDSLSTSQVCFAGLTDTVVPITIGDKVVAYLQTGQVALRKPSKAAFSKITRQLIEWGTELDFRQLETAYFLSRHISPQQYQAMIRLLETFAQHLGIVANQLVIHKDHEESPLVTRAKQHIVEHQQEELSLSQIAKLLNVSTFHFCKMFKKSTGLTFTDYLARTRIERSKTLLMNPHSRVSEIAYDCGFVSLTHFNRLFKRVVGQSPTEYRRCLAR